MNKVGSHKLLYCHRKLWLRRACSLPVDTTGGGKEIIKATSIKSGCSHTTMSRETHFVLQEPLQNIAEITVWDSR